MNIDDIKRLLHSFYEGETSQEEELIIYNFFLEEDIPDDLVLEKRIFLKLYSGQENDVPPYLEEKLNILIDDLEKEEKSRSNLSIKLINKSWRHYIAIAASILVVLSVGIWIYSENSNNKKPILVDTFSNPEEAYIETQKTLLLVASKLNKGFCEVEKVNEIIDKDAQL